MLLPVLTVLGALATPPDVDSDLAARWFAEAAALAEADGGALWGHRLGGPLLFVDPASGRVVANRPDPRGELVRDGDVWVGPLPEAIGIANTAQSWQGELWTTVVWPLPTDEHDRRKLLAHEMFHRLQPELGECRFGTASNEHLDTGTGRAWLRLEWRALADALVHDGELRRRALTDALLFRATRHGLFPAAHAAEVALEGNEGVAEYTGLKLCGLPDAVQRDRAAARLGQDERHERLVRSFAYASGPAYGLLLDGAPGDGPGWREGFDGTVDFGAVAAARYGITLPEDVETAARQRLDVYDGEQVLDEEAARERRRQLRLTAHRARFVDGPVLLLSASEEVRYSFDPHRVESLPGHGQVYEALTVTDAWGELRVDAGGALLERDDEGRVARFRIIAPERIGDGEARGDGWRLRLAEGWSLVDGERAGDFTLSRS